MKIGSLFAGIGGFDLAAKWVGWETAWYSEIDPYACAVMQKNFPGVPNLGDIRTIDGKLAPAVDLLCGGFPCQDISLAGKGAGLTGSRSGLWSEFARLIGEIRPPWVVIENSPALRGRGLDQMLRQISEIGFDAEWHCIPAANIGAAHQRDRIWIIAYPSSDGLWYEPRGSSWACWSGTPILGRDGPDQSLANATRNVCPEQERGGTIGQRTWSGGQSRNVANAGGHSPSRLEQCIGEARERDWWQPEPNVGRVAHGVPARVDRMRCLGNAIVPQVAEVIFRSIAACQS